LAFYQQPSSASFKSTSPAAGPMPPQDGGLRWRKKFLNQLDISFCRGGLLLFIKRATRAICQPKIEKPQAPIQLNRQFCHTYTVF
jgi:hypothetical protein